MKRGWLIGMPADNWSGLKRGKVYKLPPSWFENWVNGWASSLDLYELFLGSSSEDSKILCAGTILTAPYVTPNGWTMEILPQYFFSSKVSYEKVNGSGEYYFLPITGDELACLYSELGTANKKAKRKLKSLEILREKELAYEKLISLIIRSGCTSEEVKEIIKTLVKVTNSYHSDEALGELKQLVDYIAFLLHVDERSSEEWVTLWENLLEDWRNFTITLKPSEIKRLEQEPNILSLSG